MSGQYWGETPPGGRPLPLDADPPHSPLIETPTPWMQTILPPWTKWLTDVSETRMHSSRMRTICSSNRLLGGVCPRRCLPGGVSARGCLPRGVCVYASMHWGRPPPRGQNSWILDTRLWKHYLSATSFVDSKHDLPLRSVTMGDSGYVTYKQTFRCMISFPAVVLTDGTECLRIIANTTHNINNEEMVDTTNRPTVTFSNRMNVPVAVTSLLTRSRVSSWLLYCSNN